MDTSTLRGTKATKHFVEQINPPLVAQVVQLRDGKSLDSATTGTSTPDYWDDRYPLKGHECKLISRNQNNLRFTSLKKTLAEFHVDDAFIDGEIISIDQQGVSQFNSLLDRKHEPILYAFDLLRLNGEDLRQQPLIVRKKLTRRRTPL